MKTKKVRREDTPRKEREMQVVKKLTSRNLVAYFWTEFVLATHEDNWYWTLIPARTPEKQLLAVARSEEYFCGPFLGYKKAKAHFKRTMVKEFGPSARALVNALVK